METPAQMCFGHGSAWLEPRHARAALGQHLVDMPVRPDHRIEDAADVWDGDVLVEQIGHGVDEDHPEFSPIQGETDPFRLELQVEALLVRMPRDAAESLREGHCIAVIGAWTYLGAPCDRIPCCIRPLDGARIGHANLPQWVIGSVIDGSNRPLCRSEIRRRADH